MPYGMAMEYVPWPLKVDLSYRVLLTLSHPTFCSPGVNV